MRPKPRRAKGPPRRSRERGRKDEHVPGRPNMAMIRSLPVRPLHKLWGRTDLRPFFPIHALDRPIGEMLFEDGEGDDLLVKYLFTSQPLSIQVHPDDATARAHGAPGGKEEAWLILAAEPGAAIGLGLDREMTAEALAGAARDGSIARRMRWRRVAAGEMIHVPPGTIHAIGAGISLIEIQQNRDITYRLYDHGRARELHLDRALDAAVRGPCAEPRPAQRIARGHDLVVEGKAFTVLRWSGAGEGRIESVAATTFVPIGAATQLNGETAAPGTIWAGTGEAHVRLGPAGALLIAFPGTGPAPRVEWRAQR